MAKDFYQVGNYEKASKLYDSLMEKADKTIDDIHMATSAYCYNNEYLKAIKLSLQSIEKDREFLSNYSNLLNAFYKLENKVEMSLIDADYINILIDTCNKVQNGEYSEKSEKILAERVLKWINNEGFKNIENKNT